MTQEQWERLSGWFNAWLAGDAFERTRLRARLAVDAPELVEDADSLTAGSSGLDGFLETPALVLDASHLAGHDATFQPRARIGPYRIAHLIARGGMGDVYRATDVRLNRDVAVKVLSGAGTGDRRRGDRFLQEARVTASLDHPNVVRVLDVGREEDRAYLVSELLEGETLRARILRGPMPAGEVMRIGREIAAGLGAAHAAGLVHRDLKPENVFLTRSGTTKLLDFGIAKLSQQDAVPDGGSTLTGVVLGTAGYLSPEQIRAQPVDARTDLFALGAVLHEMVTGSPAFGREHIVETLHAILHDHPPDLRVARWALPPPLAAVVMRLLDKAPDGRFPSAAAVISALDGVASPATSRDGQAPPGAWTPPAGSPATASRATRPRRRSLATAAAVLATLLVAAGLAARLGRIPAQAPPAAPADVSTLTLAVLPFRSIPAASDGALLETGLAEVFISRLSQLPGVRVLPLTATTRAPAGDPQEAARQLGANRVLTVTLQRDGTSVRAIPALLATDGERPLWTTTVDADASNVFILQDIIVSRVMETLAPHLAPDARRALADAGTRNSAAFEAHLRGRAYVLSPTRAELTRAAAEFEEAVSLDPGYADAWAGLGTAYRRMPIGGDGGTGWLLKSKEAATRALSIVPEHAEAQAALGMVAFWYDWEYARAERLLRRALELQPGVADLHVSLAHLLSNLGRHDEALDGIRRARAMDPAWPVPRSLEGQFLFFARRYEDALAQLDAIVAIEPRFPSGHIMRTYPLLALGRYDEAVDECNRATELRRQVDPSERLYAWALALKGYALARSGRRTGAETLLAQLQREAEQPEGTDAYVTRYGEALILHGLGRDDEALRRLTDAVDRREHRVAFLGVDPKWDGLRDSPAFQDLLARVNLLDVSNARR